MIERDNDAKQILLYLSQADVASVVLIMAEIIETVEKGFDELGGNSSIA